ncbi:hypothetical protein J6590_058359 [Homalodisca vitripennis]|nr:hypothetical protein J6590_058359 [Homalodisca vitripennis]
MPSERRIYTCQFDKAVSNCIVSKAIQRCEAVSPTPRGVWRPVRGMVTAARRTAACDNVESAKVNDQLSRGRSRLRTAELAYTVLLDCETASLPTCRCGPYGGSIHFGESCTRDEWYTQRARAPPESLDHTRGPECDSLTDELFIAIDSTLWYSERRASS